MIKIFRNALDYVVDWLSKHVPPYQSPASAGRSEQQAAPEEKFGWYGEICK